MGKNRCPVGVGAGFDWLLLATGQAGPVGTPILLPAAVAARPLSAVNAGVPSGHHACARRLCSR